MSLEGQVHIAEWSSSVARRAHNPEVAGSNPVSAIEKRDTRKNLVSFFYALRPTGSRGCSTDRCRWQKKEGDAGEKSRVPQTERREGKRTTRFRGGQGRFKSCLRKRKRDTRKKSCILGCRQSRHPKSKSGFRLAKTEE